MKALAKLVFGFTDDQLWGPSESRNAPDARYDTSPAWSDALAHLRLYSLDWISTVLPRQDGKADARAHNAIFDWFYEVASVHGFVLDKRDNNVMVPSLESLFPAFQKRSLTARYVLQTLGTEFGRKQDPKMWNRYSLKHSDLLLAGGHNYNREHGAVADDTGLATNRGPKPYGVAIITDGRFPNEAVGVKQRGGLLINVLNPDSNNASVEKAGVAGHVSEKGIALIPRHWYDAMVVNDKTNGLLALAKVVETIVDRIQKSVDLFATATPTEVMHSC